MFSLLKKIFGSKPKEETQPEAAPYKVETVVSAEPTPVAEKALAGSYGQLGLFRELGGGDAAKGLGVYANVMGPEAKGLQGLLAKYADPMKLMALKTTDPDLYNYVRAQLSAQIGLPGVMSKPTGKAFD